MISLLITAIVMGALGSFHCIGMCGPIAISLPVIANSPSSRFLSTLLYNSGRVVTYSILGALFGIAGSGFALFGYQQLLSICLGILIMVFILLPKHISTKSNPINGMLAKIRSFLGNLFLKKNYHSVFSIGIINGLLPCGLVYLALAGAVSTGSILKSMAFMAAFGLGTLPVMWSVAFFGGFVNLEIRQKIRNIYPYMMFGIAVLLIVRGLSLNIPFISPEMKKDNTGKELINCHD
jgi:sulfite exporter TauE/SafE